MKKAGFYFLGIMTVFLVGWRTTDNFLRFGDGTNVADKQIIADLGLGATNPMMSYNVLTSKWQFTNDGVNTKLFGSGSGSGSGINLLDNPGCENGTSTPDNWAASGGSLTRTTISVEVGYETAACKFDASALGQSVKPSDVLVPEILEGKPCVAAFSYKADSITAGDYIFYAELDDATDITASVSLTATNGAWREAYVSFICPLNDSIRFKIESAVANPAAILFDQAHLGSASSQYFDGDSVEIVAQAYFATTANCSWQRTNATLGAFGTDTDCPAITVETSSPIATINAADTDLPQIVFTALPAGVYEVEASFTSSFGAAVDQSYGISDGTNTRGNISHALTQSTDIVSTNIKAIFTHTGGAKTFAAFGAAASSTVDIRNQAASQRLTWTVTRYPESSTSKVSLATQGWFINANIFGANPNLTVGDVSAYTEITDAGLSMELKQGSADAKIPCSTTNAPSGLTCSAGSESLGVAFNPPYAGSYMVCMQFTHLSQGGASDEVLSTFRLNETPTNAQTITTQSDTTSQSRKLFVGTEEFIAFPNNLCSIVSFSSVTEKVIRLMYTQDQTNTIVSSLLLADRASGVTGTRDINVKVFPITQNFPQAVALTELVTQSATCNVTKEFCQGTYTPTITNSTNVAASVASLARWMKVGNKVSVTGLVEIDPTSTGDTVIKLSLPIASALTLATDVNGTGNGQGSANYQPAIIIADTPLDLAFYNFIASDLASRSHYYSYMYELK